MHGFADSAWAKGFLFPGLPTILHAGGAVNHPQPVWLQPETLWQKHRAIREHLRTRPACNSMTSCYIRSVLLIVAVDYLGEAVELSTEVRWGVSEGIPGHQVIGLLEYVKVRFF